MESIFVAIDFETANESPDSACAVALVRVEQGKIVERKTCLLKPPDSYFQFTFIHGITWDNVSKKETFAQAWPKLTPLLKGASFLAAHNAKFDSGVLRACCATAGLAVPVIPFRCTVALARKTWNIYPTKLPIVCSHLGLNLDHYDPGSDAEACARIVLAAELHAKKTSTASATSPSAKKKVNRTKKTVV